jgi:hypothetical protein
MLRFGDMSEGRKDILKPNELVCEDVSLPSIYRMCEAGEIKSFKVGGQWRIALNGVEIPDKDNFRPDEVAKIFRVSLTTVYLMIKLAQIKVSKIRPYKIARTEILRIISGDPVVFEDS